MPNIRGYSIKVLCISLIVAGALFAVPIELPDEPNPLLGAIPILGLRPPFGITTPTKITPQSEVQLTEDLTHPEAPKEPEKAHKEPVPIKPEDKPEPKTEKGEYIMIEATAYSLRGKMFNGKEVHHGAISVDPKVIPLGSKLYIEGFGEGTAEDTGSAIKGNKMDIWMPSYDQAVQWGRRKVKVWIKN